MREMPKIGAYPDTIVAAAAHLWRSDFTLPPTSLGNALLLGNLVAMVESPLDKLTRQCRPGVAADLSLVMSDQMLKEITAESAAEIASLQSVLNP